MDGRGFWIITVVGMFGHHSCIYPSLDQSALCFSSTRNDDDDAGDVGERKRRWAAGGSPRQAGAARGEQSVPYSFG